jgi:hypothetical protein
MDVKSAFVNGELAKEVHVQRQPGFAMKGAEQKGMEHQAQHQPHVARIHQVQH